MKELFIIKYCSIAFVILPGLAGGLAQELASNIYALMLDAAPAGDNDDKSGGMTREEEDCIMNELVIDGGIRKDALLIVGVHHPVISFERG